MDGFHIEPRFFDDKEPGRGMLYVLCPDSGKSFIDELARSDVGRLSRILVTAKRIYDYGCAFGFASQTIKRIEAGKCAVAVFEVRVKGTVIRVAAHIHNSAIPIYLFDFDTHQGARSHLPRRHIDHAKELAAIAAKCAEQFDFSDYRGAV